ncbi:hypothetical protein V8C86DRAFT_2446599 [Haematococcus lacustris]
MTCNIEFMHVQALRPDCSTSTMALTSRRPNPSDWVAIQSDGQFFWFHEDGGSTLIRNECHESCLATCECLIINIDSESITSHLSPRIQAALRIRRHPLALQLIVATQLGPHTMRCRVEGVVELLGCCEAVHSVEIRYIDEEQAMKEEPTYEQLPVGAWLAERLMASFPNCLTLRLRDFQCQHAQLAELLSHSHFLGSLQNLNIQELHIQGGSVEDGHYEWAEGYLGLTVLSTVYLGPVPTPLQPCPSKLVKLCLTEMHLTATSLLPQTIKILNITYLHVTLPEPDHQAMTSGVAALSSGRFQTLEIEYMGLSITSLEGEHWTEMNEVENGQSPATKLSCCKVAKVSITANTSESKQAPLLDHLPLTSPLHPVLPLPLCPQLLGLSSLVSRVKVLLLDHAGLGLKVLVDTLHQLS